MVAGRVSDTMVFGSPSPDQLSQVISHAIAPAFLLGAVASFVSVLFTRMTTIPDRLRTLNALPDEGHPSSALKPDIPRLRRRATLTNKAIFLSVCSGVAAAILLIVAFLAASLGVEHVFGAAILFIVSLAFLAAALVMFALEVRIELTEYDHH